ncbi:MAG: cytochrome P450 [Candidatus Rokubacteria bacterium]|nr:cytochrome P450 [Candidatus Rokubacteria bacterium]
MASSEVVFNPLLPEFHADPYPFYRRLREEDPVHQSPLGIWILTRYDDTVMVLRDPRFGREGMAELMEARLGAGSVRPANTRDMLFRDPPDHTRLRALVSRAFTPRVVEAMRPHIQEIVDGLLDRVEGARGMDVIEDLAYPLPVTVICEMLGVPTADQDVFKQWSADIARSLDASILPAGSDVITRGQEAGDALREYFRSLIAVRRKSPQPDLLSALIAAEEQGDKLSEPELVATCVLLLIAGHETTVNLIGNGVLALLRHPAELRALANDPALIPTAVVELLRYDGPVQRTGRRTMADVEIGGRQIPKGSIVAAVIGAANRDPAHFPDPDRLDVARRENRHIAFGFGIHFCLGAPLARIEGQVAIGTLLRRMPALKLVSDTPEWRESSVLRGLKTLPVTF